MPLRRGLLCPARQQGGHGVGWDRAGEASTEHLPALSLLGVASAHCTWWGLGLGERFKNPFLFFNIKCKMNQIVPFKISMKHFDSELKIKAKLSSLQTFRSGKGLVTGINW